VTAVCWPRAGSGLPQNANVKSKTAKRIRILWSYVLCFLVLPSTQWLGYYEPNLAPLTGISNPVQSLIRRSAISVS
jgi:hypothetical protein